jgi:hypothetical protein
VQGGIGRQLGVTGVANHHALLVAPFGCDAVTSASDGAPEDIESWAEVPDARRRERPDT